LIYRSSPQEMILLESALKRTSLTGPLCPINLKGLICGLKFHTSTIPSAPPDTTCFLELMDGIHFFGEIDGSDSVLVSSETSDQWGVFGSCDCSNIAFGLFHFQFIFKFYTIFRFLN
jgi:hypothetical protein